MSKKRTSGSGRIRETVSEPDAPVQAAPQSSSEPAAPMEPGGLEAAAAAVALAIDRRRRASRSMAPAFKIAGTAGPDEWATSGRLAQINRYPVRDPWDR